MEFNRERFIVMNCKMEFNRERFILANNYKLKIFLN